MSNKEPVTPRSIFISHQLKFFFFSGLFLICIDLYALLCIFCLSSVSRLSFMSTSIYALLISESASWLPLEVWVKFCWIRGWAVWGIFCVSVWIHLKIWKIPRTSDPSFPCKKCYNMKGVLLKYFHHNSRLHHCHMHHLEVRTSLLRWLWPWRQWPASGDMKRGAQCGGSG